jgi:hypothetical protein
MRTAACEKIRDVTCIRVRPVTINHIGVVLDDRALYVGDAPAYHRTCTGGGQPETAWAATAAYACSAPGDQPRYCWSRAIITARALGGRPQAGG